MMSAKKSDMSAEKRRNANCVRFDVIPHGGAPQVLALLLLQGRMSLHSFMNETSDGYWRRRRARAQSVLVTRNVSGMHCSKCRQVLPPAILL
jgi:hypothetical protein